MIDGTIAFISGLDIVKGARDGKLEPNAIAGRPELGGALLSTEFPNVSEVSVTEGTGSRVDGAKELELKFTELKMGGGKEDGSSGKFEAPVGKEALILGYCIGGCSEEGIDSPGGGWSKEC